MASNRSPYEISGRLSDVIAAITVLAADFSSEAKIESWVRKLCGPAQNPTDAEMRRWTPVFAEHPEFFIVYELPVEGVQGGREIKAALRLRYANKTIDRETRKEHLALAKLPMAERSRLTSLPLAPAEVDSLVSAAINLHAVTMARNSDARYWMQLVGPVLGLVGVLLALFYPHVQPKSAPQEQHIRLSVDQDVRDALRQNKMQNQPTSAPH